jgi:hypothetical protein
MANESKRIDFSPSEQARLDTGESLVEQISRYRRENPTIDEVMTIFEQAELHLNQFLAMSNALQPKTMSLTSRTTAEEFSVQLSATTRST